MKTQISEDELFFGLVIMDTCLFAEMFFKEDVSLGLSVKQKLMFLDEDKHKLLCCGRKCAKTVYIEVCLLQFSFLYNGEGLFFTPGANHIAPTRARIMTKVYQNPLFSAMMDSFNKNEGIMSFRKGAFIWHWRIEGMDGTDKNMVGLRARVIIGDELAFGNMVCHQSRGQVALPNCKWIYAGVPNAWHSGILYALDQTRLGDTWSKHKLTSYDNPMYVGREQELITLYGGENTWEYQTQVLGKWGGELERSFPPGALAINERSPFGRHFFIANLVSSNIHELDRLIDLPKVNAENYIIGVDYGYSPDPSEVIIFYENGEDEWVELARITMKSIIASHQGMVIHTINKKLDFKVKAISVEYVSGGAGIVQELQRTDTAMSPGAVFPYSEVCINANPGGIIEVPTITIPTTEQMIVAGIPDFSFGSKVNDQGLVRVHRKVWMTHLLRDSMVRANQGIAGTKLFVSGQDQELQDSIINTLEKTTASGAIVYDRIDKTIPDHPIDAARCAICAIHFFNERRSEQLNIRNGLEFGFFGWAGTAKDWRQPWK